MQFITFGQCLCTDIKLNRKMDEVSNVEEILIKENKVSAKTWKVYNLYCGKVNHFVEISLLLDFSVV
jgi:hypothetical protein